MTKKEEELLIHFETEYIKYRSLVKQSTDITRNVTPKLIEYYNDEKIKEYKTFDDLLDDLNWLCPDIGVGKLIAIREIKDRYEKMQKIR